MSVEAIKASQVKPIKPKKIKEEGRGGKAVASALMPGLGQFCDGRNKDGAKFLLGSIGLDLASLGIIASIVAPVVKSFMNERAAMTEGVDLRTILSEIKNPKAKVIGLAGLAIVGFGLWVVNIVDAAKGGLKKTKKPSVKIDSQTVEPTQKQEDSIFDIIKKGTAPIK